MLDIKYIKENPQEVIDRLAKKGKLVNWKELNERAKVLLERISFDVDPRKLVGSLTVAEKQMVEIAKALSRNSRIILMDEPSATLTKKELDALFQIKNDIDTTFAFRRYVLCYSL